MGALRLLVLLEGDLDYFLYIYSGGFELIVRLEAAAFEGFSGLASYFFLAAAAFIMMFFASLAAVIILAPRKDSPYPMH